MAQHVGVFVSSSDFEGFGELSHTV
jgi:hypothetical protein